MRHPILLFCSLELNLGKWSLFFRLVLGFQTCRRFVDDTEIMSCRCKTIAGTYPNENCSRHRIDH